MKKIFCLLTLTFICSALYSQQFIPTEEAMLNEARYLAANPNRIENIPRILSLMRNMGVPDMNKDGKINCIDYSILFRMFYGSNARILINKNPKNGMNHMFIRIYYNDMGHTRVLDIDPQGTPDRYSMGLIWGMRYEPIHNRDVTSQWGQYVGGMY